MKGEIKVTSKVNEGSTFKVSFPFKQKKRKDVKELNKDVDYGALIKNVKVLIVDDNEINHEVLKGVFEDFEISLFHAYNGFECIEITDKEMPDIILMDFHMPDIDGTEVTRRLKKSFSTASIPVLGVSADAFKSSKTQALESGMVGYITKPIDFDLLFSLMVEYLPKVESNDGAETLEDPPLKPAVKEKINTCISAIKKHEIYETEKLMNLVAEIEKVITSSASNSLIGLVPKLKEAVLSGEETVLNKLTLKIKKIIS